VLKGIVLGLLAFGVFFVTHVALFRFRAPARRFDAMVRAHWLLVPALGVAYAVTPPDLGVLPAAFTGAGWVLDLANSIIVYDFLFIGYSMLYFLVDRGFSARILIEIERAPNRALTLEGVAAVYAPEEIVGRRLGDLADIKSVVKEGERFQIVSRGRRQARLFSSVKAFFNLGPGG